MILGFTKIDNFCISDKYHKLILDFWLHNNHCEFTSRMHKFEYAKNPVLNGIISCIQIQIKITYLSIFV